MTLVPRHPSSVSISKDQGRKTGPVNRHTQADSAAHQATGGMEQGHFEVRRSEEGWQSWSRLSTVDYSRRFDHRPAFLRACRYVQQSRAELRQADSPIPTSPCRSRCCLVPESNVERSRSISARSSIASCILTQAPLVFTNRATESVGRGLVVMHNEACSEKIACEIACQGLRYIYTY